MKREFREDLFQHIQEYAGENEIYIDTINGDKDHLHCLVGLHPVLSPAKVVNLLKGESSHWINKNDFLKVKFAWQEGYSVFSVSASEVSKVRKHIQNEEGHHRKVSYRDEVEIFFEAFGVSGGPGGEG